MTLARWAAIAVILAAVVLAVAFADRFGEDPGAVASPLIGRQVPALELPGLGDDPRVDFQALPAEVTVVNFWASWCLECRLEHDDLTALARDYQDAGVEVLGVVFNDRAEQATAMLDELGRTYRHVEDVEGRAAVEFGVFGVPETFFVGGDGTIVAKITGPASYQLLASTVEQILVGQTPGGVTTGTVQSTPDQ